MKRSEYDEMIRKKPSLRPTEVIKSQNTHITAIGLGGHLSLPESVHTTITGGPYELGEPNGVRVTIEQEKCVKSPPEAIKSPKVLKFTIPGQPVGKPRQTQSDRWKKRPCVMRYRAWADKARAAVPNGVSLGVYRQIAFVAYLEFPKSYSVTKRAWLTGQPHLQKPDIDNIAKSCGDSLFPDDKVIWKFSGEKRWDDGKGSRIEVELK